MRDYKLYFFNVAGHIHRAIDLQCESDDEAIAAAERHANGDARELWQRSRLVKVFGAGRNTSP